MKSDLGHIHFVYKVKIDTWCIDIKSKHYTATVL